MRWVGKVTGAAVGALLGPIGVAVGVLLGHEFDKGVASEMDRSRPRARPSAYPFRETLLEATFSIMGYIAMRDGKITHAEKQAAARVIAELKLEGTRERTAWQSFEIGGQDNFALDRQVHRLNEIARGRRDLIRAFVDMQMHVALANGSMSAATRLALKNICRRLGVGPIEFAQTEALARVRAGASRAAAIVRADNAVDKAAAVLGVDTDADEDTIKKAYRRLMNRHHPDKLAGQDPSEADLARARERTHEIRMAYETLMQAREN